MLILMKFDEKYASCNGSACYTKISKDILSCDLLCTFLCRLNYYIAVIIDECGMYSK